MASKRDKLSDNVNLLKTYQHNVNKSIPFTLFLLHFNDSAITNENNELVTIPHGVNTLIMTVDN